MNIPLDFFDFSTPYGANGVPRRSLVFSFGTDFPLPQQPYFDLPNDLQTLNLSNIFPMPPQYSISGLPYIGHGSTNVTLSSLGSGVFVGEDTTIVPFYASGYFLALLIVADVALLCWGVQLRKRRGG